MQWKSIPFFKILIPYIVGVFCAIYAPVEWYYSLGVVIFLLLIAVFIGYWVRKKLAAYAYHWVGLILAIALLFLGFFRADTYKDINRANHFSKHQSKVMLIKVNSFPEEKYNNLRFEAQVLYRLDSLKKTPTRGNLLVYWSKENKTVPEVGDLFWINSKYLSIPGPKNPGEFNYKAYLGYYNIYFKTYIKEKGYQYVLSNASGTQQLVVGIRKYVLGVFEKYLPDKSAFLIAQALVLGGKNSLDENVKSYFAQTGTLHVLAVSGLHVGIVFLLLGWLTKPLDRFKKLKGLKVILLLLGVWVYALVTGFSPSVQRAALMFSIIGLGGLFNVKGFGLNSLFASAFIMLAYNPFLIVNVGFQLSYSAVLGIMLIYQPVYQWISFSFIKKKWLWYITDSAWQVCAISFAAQLATFPISLFYFGQVPIYFLFSNLLVIPAIFLMVYMSIFIVAFSKIAMLANAIAVVFKYFAWILVWMVKGVSALPFAYAAGLHLNFFQTLLLYAVILFFTIWLHYKQIKQLNTALLLLTFLLLAVNVKYIYNSGRSTWVAHSIKKSTVITKLIGNEAFVIADSAFIANKSAQKFYLDPYFRTQYIKKIHFKVLPAKLGAINLNVSKDTLNIYCYTTKYPNFKRVADKSALFFAARNNYTDTFFKPDKKVLWTSQSPYLKNPKSAPYNLDSLAVMMSF